MNKAKENGLQVMSVQDVNKYMTEVLNGRALEGMEANTLHHFRAVSQELEQTRQKMEQLRQEQERLIEVAQQLTGQLDAYANVLVYAEDARRAKTCEDMCRMQPSKTKKQKTNKQKKALAPSSGS